MLAVTTSRPAGGGWRHARARLETLVRGTVTVSATRTLSAVRDKILPGLRCRERFTEWPDGCGASGALGNGRSAGRRWMLLASVPCAPCSRGTVGPGPGGQRRFRRCCCVADRDVPLLRRKGGGASNAPRTISTAVSTRAGAERLCLRPRHHAGRPDPLDSRTRARGPHGIARAWSRYPKTSVRVGRRKMTDE